MSANLDDDRLAGIAQTIRDAATDLRADNEAAERKELRSRLQVLEAWKAGAVGIEADFIEDLMEIYLDALNP